MNDESGEDLTTMYCGYCKQQCYEDDVNCHSCMQGFSSFSVDPNKMEFWGVNSNGEAVYELSEEDLLDTNSEIDKASFNENTLTVLCPLQPKSAAKNRRKTKLNLVQERLDIDEHLILEVQKRKPLWNFTIPIQERGRAIKDCLWQEVSTALDGVLTADGAKKKFKSLHDAYRKIILAEKCSSGSARKTISKWAHYDSMEFLRPLCTARQTLSNCTTDDSDVQNLSDDESAEKENQCSSSKIVTKSKKRKNSNDKDEFSSSIDKIATALTNSNKEIILPPLPVVDEINSCLNLIGCRIRKIPIQHQSEVAEKLLLYSFELSRNYNI